MAKKISSRKAKARRGQQEVRDEILEKFSKLTERDVVSQPMGVPGADIRLSQLASEKFPFSVEVKNTERLNIWDALEQAEDNAEKDGLTPLVCFTRNYADMYAVIKLGDFMELIDDD